MSDPTAAEISPNTSGKSGDTDEMSRFHKLNGSSFRVWAPPGGAYKIEYTTALICEVRLESAQTDATGVLYGRLDNGSIRVMAARPEADPTDPRLAGLAPVGIFAARVRGEVFLTEADLERFEKIESEAVVALVVAGSRAGFFVHEADGSLQSIKSHLEFSLDEPGGETTETPAAPVRRKKLDWRLLAAALIALSIAPAVWIAHRRWHPPPRPALELTLQDRDTGLRIEWNRAAIERTGALEIVDGNSKETIDAAGLNGVTYARRTGDVQVRLAGETARFIGADPPVRAIDRLRKQVAELEAEAHDLKTTAASRNRRVAELERILSKMDLAH